MSYVIIAPSANSSVLFSSFGREHYDLNMASLEANPHRSIKYFDTFEDINRVLKSPRHADIRDKFLFLKITDEHGFETADKSQSFGDFLKHVIILECAEIVEMPAIELFDFTIKAKSYNLYISRRVDDNDEFYYNLVNDLNKALIWHMHSQSEIDRIIAREIQPEFDIPLNSLIISKVPKFI